MKKPPLFHVGQLITPVRTDFDAEEGVVLRVKMGAVYTVNWVVFVSRSNAQGWYIGCEEWPQDEASHESGYAPVEEMPAETYAELLEALEPVTA